MKATYLIISCLAIAGCAGLQTQPDAEIGFRDAIIGTAPSAEMVRLEKWKPTLGISSREISDTYSKPNESRKLGDLVIKNVTYEYYNQQLFRIEIDLWTDTQKNCPQSSQIIAALESHYGITMTRHQIDYAKSQHLAQWRGSQAWITYMCQPWNLTNMIRIESPRIKKDIEARLQAIRSEIERKDSENMQRAL